MLESVTQRKPTRDEIAAMSTEVRAATVADARGVAAIYGPVVETTHVTFEVRPPTADQMALRIAAITEALPWLVASSDGDVAGFAYAAPHGSREAYLWSVDTSIYLAPSARGRGVGTRLYRTLLACLTELGYVSAFAGVALPNPASVALHQRLGFVRTGAFPMAGFKLGRWHDVSLWRCQLVAPPELPQPPARWQPHAPPP